MKLGKCTVRNFQSYLNLEFDYSDQGLALISGQTGAGKSTLMDAAPWILYGVTSKEGAADDVRSWNGGNTVGRLTVVLNDGMWIDVIRQRGSTNDLYWTESDFPERVMRGKDLKDTQKLLEARLGVSAELFLIGSYMHQFSKADSFFIASAKDRREVLEKIADQEFAVKLGERASAHRKDAKDRKAVISSDLSRVQGALLGYERSLEGLQSSSKSWDALQVSRIKDLKHKFDNYDREYSETVRKRKELSEDWLLCQEDKAHEIADRMAEIEKNMKSTSELADMRGLLEDQINDLGQPKCPTCGQLCGAADRAYLQAEIVEINHKMMYINAAITQYADYEKQLASLSAEKDPFAVLPSSENPYRSQYAYVTAETNPFEERIQATHDSIQEEKIMVSVMTRDLNGVNDRLNKFTWLYDKSFELRGLLMAQSVSRIQNNTNEYLEKFFDAALRVNFFLDGSDKIDVEIFSDGHIAPFKQLSGGERCMLKLAFSLSLMRAAQDKSGISFGMIMLDEALNGLDDSLKVKAFSLLQQLSTEYTTVLCIDHSDAIKQEFSRKFVVTKDNGHSILTEE